MALLCVLSVATVLTACGTSATPGGAAPAGGSSNAQDVRPTPADAASLAPASAVSDLRTVVAAALPSQAIDTLRLIAKSGPYPFSKDGVTFSNREGRLPRHSSGWYQEYTVITPGSSDRGARRIVAGHDGGRFYTDGHYASFHEVLSGVST